jgi:Tfp pilus assembly protein PilN
MINLLPNQTKESIGYARRNTILFKWVMALGVFIAGVLIIVALGLFYMDRSINSLSTRLEQTKNELKAQNLEDTQTKVDEISGSLKLVVQVLSREVLFSELIKQIGAVVPANAALTDLEIGKVEGAIDLTAVATDYNTATQVQVNLSDPSNKIFDQADIVNITCAATSTDPRYPCTINIRARFAKKNPFLFINKGGGS